MGDVLIENPANSVPPHKKTTSATIPSIENFEGLSTEGGDDYATLKKLQRQLEYIQLQEEYIKDEQRSVNLLCQRFENRSSRASQEFEEGAGASSGGN